MSDDPLRPGPITHQRQRDDGTWEETPGWLSVDGNGNITLSVLTEEEIKIMEQMGGPWR